MLFLISLLDSDCLRCLSISVVNIFQNSFICIFYVCLPLSSTMKYIYRYIYTTLHFDLCEIEYSLGDAPTALKHGDEACLHIWHLTSNLPTSSPNLSCEFLTDKMNLQIKCSLAI